MTSQQIKSTISSPKPTPTQKSPTLQKPALSNPSSFSTDRHPDQHYTVISCLPSLKNHYSRDLNPIFFLLPEGCSCRSGLFQRGTCRWATSGEARSCRRGLLRRGCLQQASQPRAGAAGERTWKDPGTVEPAPHPHIPSRNMHK